MDELERWITSRLTKQGLVDIKVSVCLQAYQELGLHVKREVRVAPAKANPDTGAHMCVGRPGLQNQLVACSTSNICHQRKYGRRHGSHLCYHFGKNPIGRNSYVTKDNLHNYGCEHHIPLPRLLHQHGHHTLVIPYFGQHGLRDYRSTRGRRGPEGHGGARWASAM